MGKTNPRIVLAGSVNSSKKTLEKLIHHNMNIVGVLALSPEESINVSGYIDLGKIASKHNLNYAYFENINSPDSEEYIKECEPDYLFVIGLSQLVKKPLLSIPSVGSVGFHPTKLPEGRGRAAVAWLILGKAKGAATFFLMGEGMDDGPILSQKEFKVNNQDYASDVIEKIIDKAGDCLDDLLPQMKNGELKYVEQNHSAATYLGKRNPEDSHISWENSASKIQQLVRAVAEPLPGAYTYYNDLKVIIKRAEIESGSKYLGVEGSVLRNDEKGILVQTGKGLLRITEISGMDLVEMRVGRKLGINFEKKIYLLEQKLERLKSDLIDE